MSSLTHHYEKCDKQTVLLSKCFVDNLIENMDAVRVNYHELSKKVEKFTEMADKLEKLYTECELTHTDIEGTIKKLNDRLNFIEEQLRLTRATLLEDKTKLKEVLNHQ